MNNQSNQTSELKNVHLPKLDLLSLGENEITITEENEGYTRFDDMPLKKELLKGITAYGFEVPSEIQRLSLKETLTGRDCIIQAQSGQGKTGAFVITTLQQINERVKAPQAIILSPTQELSEQTCRIITSIGRFMNVKTRLCVGGSPFREDCEAIRVGAQILCGTSGRILDLMSKNVFHVEGIKIMVLDEADQLLLPDYVALTRDIIQYIPKASQVLLVSATLPSHALNSSNFILQNPARILMPNSKLPLEGIRQYKIRVDTTDYKLDTLCDIFSSLRQHQSIIFCSKTTTVSQVSECLKRNHFNVQGLHASLTREERNRIFEAFRKGELSSIVCTEALARGIDIQQLYCVVNFDIPWGPVIYLHRIGRCGRFGRKGMAVTFYTQEEAKMMDAIARHFQHDIPDLRPEDLL